MQDCQNTCMGIHPCAWLTCRWPMLVLPHCAVHALKYSPADYGTVLGMSPAAQCLPHDSTPSPHLQTSAALTYLDCCMALATADV
jgi:hypothetical protein